MCRNRATPGIAVLDLVWWMMVVCGLAGVSGSAETLTIHPTTIGTTPNRLGYNLGHFMPGSNAADWFRYSGADAARIFIGVSDIEPNDDISPNGDGVNSEGAFFNRRSLLRANAASSTATLSNSYVKWSVFTNNYSDVMTGNNRIEPAYALGTLRDRNVEILVNLTASPSRFPIAGENDWPGKWELWQHYYAQAFLLSRDYDVSNFSMFNEPNGWDGMTESDWLLRYRFCSDAIQSAIADMNSRYGKSLVPMVFAPNTANGAEKYHAIGTDEESTDTWGRDAVTNRHLQLDGTNSPAWMNLHVYNYQKYTTRTNAGGGFSGYINDFDTLRSLIDADMSGEPALPLALTEFNVRTGAQYDAITATQDSPSDYAALGANCVALASRGISQLYLFKFGQTSSASFYGVAKNGTHYVQNGAGSNHYGGASKCAEVYRLFNKAAGGARPQLDLTTTPGAAPDATAGVWSMATANASNGIHQVFIANKKTLSVPLEVDFSALPVPPGSPVFVEEVSATSSGGIVRSTRLSAGMLAEANMPAQSVWLVTVPGLAVTEVVRTAAADAMLGDGTAKNLEGGGASVLHVRADGTVNGRRVALIRVPVFAGDSSAIHAVMLELNAATSSGTVPIQAHVYGVADDQWDENTATWASMTSILKQDTAGGNLIANNIIAGHGNTAKILGQLVVDSPEMSKRSLDVTDFVKSRAGGSATFLIVQEHRWDVAQPSLTIGDTQPAGLDVASRENAALAPRLLTLTADLPPVIGTQPQSQSLNSGDTAVFNVAASGTDPLHYQWRKNGVDIGGATAPSLTLSGISGGDSGSYQVVVSNSAGIAHSVSATLVVHGTGNAAVACEATIRGGTFAESDVDEAAQGYLMVKYSSSLDTARKSYFQFDLPPTVDPESPAVFRIGFNNSFAQQVRLWGLSQVFPAISTAMTWNTAPANDLLSNNMVNIGAAAIDADVRIAPGAGLLPYAFTIPRLGDFLLGGKVTLVVSGVDHASNSSGGLRIAPGSAELQYGILPPDAPWTAWRKTRFGEGWNDESKAGPAADPDQDGLENLLEYALGGDPLAADTGVLPAIEIVPGHSEFRFVRMLQHADLRVTAQVSAGRLDVWTDAAESIYGAPFVPLIGGITVLEDTGDPARAVTIRSDASEEPHRFMRLRVELSP